MWRRKKERSSQEEMDGGNIHDVRDGPDGAKGCGGGSRLIHSGHFYSAPSSPLLLGGAPDYNTDTVSEFHAEAHRQLQVKDLPKVPPYVAARAGVEPTTFRLKVIDSIKAPPRPT